jgi:hypothetical protein
MPWGPTVDLAGAVHEPGGLAMHVRRSVRSQLTPIALAVALSGGLPADAATLWYNGDYNGSSTEAGISNGVGINAGFGVSDVLIYDDFLIPDGWSWQVDSIFSNNFLGQPVSQARWELRSGMSDGFGGTLLYSGVGSASTAPTGRSGPLGEPEYSVSVSLVELEIALPSGRYWLMVAPVGDGTETLENAIAISATGGFDGVGFTAGANAIGLPPGDNGRAFAHTPLFPLFDYLEITAFEIPEFHDFSMGIEGSASPIPEPGTALLVAIGIAGVAVRSRTRNGVACQERGARG